MNKEQITYEILEDGYMIYKDDTAWIKQHKEHVFYPELSLEENAIKHIEEIVASYEAAKKAEQEAVNAKKENEALKEQVKLQDEAINELASLVSELMMAQESEVE